MEEVDKEISEMKLSLNSRARIVAESYLVAVRLFLLYLHFDSLSSFEVQYLTCGHYISCLVLQVWTYPALYYHLTSLIKNGDAWQCTNRCVGDPV